MKIATETTTITPITSLINDYVLANKWAIETVITWLRTKPAEDLEKEIASSFPGIRGSMVHIWDTERFWLSVLKQEPAPVSYRMTGFPGTTEEAFDGAIETSREFAEYVNSLSEEELCEIVHLDTPWVKGSKTRYEFIQHCMNHSSYHRGQVITLGHHVGFHDAPMTDFSFYLFVIKK
ncbi:MAG TPA: DinB family protein [Cyclobacteriaceae bacterium]|nr:DinB family protein [Cyclobacteriaceae bacterium]